MYSRVPTLRGFVLFIFDKLRQIRLEVVRAFEDLSVFFTADRLAVFVAKLSVDKPNDRRRRPTT